MCHPTTAEDRLNSVRHRLHQASLDANRAEDSIHLLAVSKMKSAEEVRELFQLGQHAFGENYLQQALEKQALLKDLDIEWHFIGPIQSNKTREIASHFDWVHSIDREKIAQRLNDQRPEEKSPLNVCLQVNVSGEASKSGVTLSDLPSLAEFVSRLPNLKLRGLMAIPAPAETQEAQRRQFAQLRHALESLQKELPGAPLETLSMGMSGDLEAAIMEGATMVRVGTALFGPRPPFKST